MGVYVYSLKGRTKGVEFADGSIRQVGCIDYAFKPNWRSWEAALSGNSFNLYGDFEKEQYRLYRKCLANLDKKESQEFVVIGEWKKGSEVRRYESGVKWDYDTPDFNGTVVGYLVPQKGGWRVAEGKTVLREIVDPNGEAPDGYESCIFIRELVENNGNIHCIDYNKGYRKKK